MSPISAMPDRNKEPIAIVGIGCRLPGGIKDAPSFWRFLKNKGDAISEIPANRWSIDGFYDADPNVPGRSTTKWGAFLDDIYGFDPAFFDISPREVENMDPQQSGLLQVVYEAMQDAHLTMAKASKAVTGVFVGITTSDFRSMLEADRLIPHNDIYAGTGVALCIAANRISHRFNLKGPSVAMDTACSSSMVAVDMACKNIHDGACDMAIAAGVNVLAAPTTFILFSNANMLSPTGRLSTFDANANGYVRGEGFGAVVLKPLSRAVADGDEIYGLIRATCVNQDGHTKTLTAPSQDAQIAMLERLCQSGRVDPEHVGFVECHGTGTPTGDPIEAGAVGRVFGKDRRTSPLLVGSVKPNVGHLESAAGITGLIKGALVARHGLIPPNINYTKPNPSIPFDALNIEVARSLSPLPKLAGSQFVVVNSFGFGGTNASALIEAYTPPTQAPRKVRPAATAATPAAVAVPLSASTPEALKAYAARFAAEMEHGASLADATPAEIAGSIAAGRDHLNQRAVFIAATPAELNASLKSFADTGAAGSASRDALPAVISGQPGKGAKLCFTFSGQGSQWWAMGRRLLNEEPVYRGAIEAFDALFKPLAGWSVIDAMMADEEASLVDRSAVTQPTICALQIALAALWRHYGVVPDMVVGHSLGEVAAAHVAGAIDLETAVRYIYKRSLIRSAIDKDGAMAVIGLTAEEVEEILPKDGSIGIAGYNAPATVTVSGDSAAVAGLVESLKSERPDVLVRAIKTDTAWHSHHLDAGETWFRNEVGSIASSTPHITFVSTVTGQPECRLDTNYWWQNLRQPVRFREAVETAVALGAGIFLELAPHRTLSGPTSQSAAAAGGSVTLVNSLNRAHDDMASMAAAIGSLYVNGVDLDWESITGGRAKHLDLPSYPWTNAAHAKLPEEATERLFGNPGHPLLGRRVPGPLTTWRSVINLRAFRFIADHRLRDECLFPAAGYLEIMIAAGLEVFGKGPIEIEDVKIFETLFIRPDASVALQTVYQQDRDALRVYSRDQEPGSEWVLRSEGRVRQRDIQVAKGQAAAIRTPINFPHEFWYRNSGPQTFIQFGPTFQSLKNVDVELDGYRALADIALHPALSDHFACFNAHPALLDSTLQLTDHNVATLGATNNASFDAEGRFVGTTHSIPTGIRRVLFLAPFAKAMNLEVCHKVKDGKPCGNTGIFRDADGTPLVVVEDVMTKGIPITGSLSSDGSIAPTVLEESYYPVVAAQDADVSAVAAGRIIVLADDKGRIDRVVDELKSGGAEVEVVRRADLAATDLAGIQAALDQRIDAGGPVASIIFALSVEPVGLDNDSSSEAVYAAAERDVVALTALGQVFERRAEPAQATVLFVLTHKARQLPGDESVDVDGIVRAPLVGLVRTIAAECEAHPLIQIDVDDHALENPETMVKAMFGQRREAEIVLRDGQAFAPRVERRTLAELPARLKRVPSEDCKTNYVITMKSPGVIDALELREVEMPVAGADDVILEIKAVGLNFRDIMAVTGLLPAEAEPEPAWRNLGLEYGAVVSAVGANVSSLKPGDRVMGMGRRCLQRFMAMPAVALTKLADHLSLDGASTIPSAFATAHYALNHVARLRKGERVLIHVATGGVGLAAVQLAKRVGAEIFATAGSEDKRAFLRSLGIKHVMSSRSLDFAEEIMSITGGRGVDVILNSLPNAYIKKGLDILAPYGRFVEIGKRDVYADAPLGMKALRKNIQLAVLDLAALGLERPELMAELLSELNQMFADHEIEPLPVTAFPASRAADAFRHMSQAKHIGKVVVTFDDPVVDIRVSTEKAFRLEPNASYLVTGGSRGFGLAVADWLSRSGAARIVLASRSGKVDEAEQAGIAAIAQRGTAVDSLALDVNDAKAVDEAMAALATHAEPLRGIVHGAAIIEDALLSQLDDALVRRVLSPKVAGAWNLHKALEKAGHEVDFLVSFSSTSQLLGSRGQANYVAANAFLDAFAHYRRRRGLAAFTADWGPLGGSGVVARNMHLASYMQSMGMHLVEDRDATKALETFLCADRVSLAYTAIDWAKFRRSNPRVEQNPRLAPLVADVGGTKTRVRAEIAATARAEWPSKIAEFLKGEVAKVLKIDAEKVSADRPLTELGLDSLSSFEFKSCIEDELGLEMSVSKFLQAPTIDKLAGVVVEIIEAQADKAESAAAAAVAESGDAAATPGAGQDGFVPSDRQMSLLAIERGRLTTNEARAALRNRVELTVNEVLEPTRLDAALATLAERHPMLRLGLDARAGFARAELVLGPAPRALAHDGPLPADAGSLEVSRGELLRIDIGKPTGTTTKIVVTAHAVCLDRWSLAHMVEELLCLYADPAYCPADARSGADVLAVLGERRFDAERRAAQIDRAYWYETMTPWIAPIDLGQRARPSAPAGLGRSQGQAQSVARTFELGNLDDQHGLARECLLLTAFGLALADVSKADAVVVNRESAHGEGSAADLLGPFAEELPVPFRACSSTPGERQLARVRRHMDAASSHRSFDAHSIETVLGDQMRANGALPSQATFAYSLLGSHQRAKLAESRSAVTIGGLTVEGGLVEPAGLLSDVALSILDCGAWATVTLRYSTDAVDDQLATRLLARLEAWIGMLAGSGPDQPTPPKGRHTGPRLATTSSRPASRHVPASTAMVHAYNGNLALDLSSFEPLEGLLTMTQTPPVAAPPKPVVRRVADYPVGRFENVVLDLVVDPAATPEFLRSWTISHALRVSKPIDARRLQEAFRKVVARHDTLRARFTRQHGAWRMIVEDQHRTGLVVTDLGTPDDTALRAWIDAAAREPFDIEHGPLFKLDLLKCGSRGDVMLVRAHHLVTDGWSQILLSDELVRAGFGLPFTGPPPLSYGEFLKRFERAQTARDEADFEAYWRRLILPALPAPRLGRIAKGRAPNLTGLDLGPTDRHVARLDAGELAAVHDLSKAAGCTLSNLVGAAFATVLAERGGVDGVYFNTPVAARVHPDMKSFIGFACDFFPVRCDVADAGSLRELAHRIGEQLRQSFQNTPASATKCDPAFDHLVNDAGGHLRQFECGMLIPEATGRQSLVAPLLNTGAGSVVKLGPVEIEWIDAASVRTTSAELDLRTIERRDGLEFIFAFDTTAFDAPEVAAIAEAFKARLTGRPAAAGSRT